MVVDVTTTDESRELLLVLPGLLDAVRCAAPGLPRLAALERCSRAVIASEGGGRDAVADARPRRCPRSRARRASRRVRSVVSPTSVSRRRLVGARRSRASRPGARSSAPRTPISRSRWTSRGRSPRRCNTLLAQHGFALERRCLSAGTCRRRVSSTSPPASPRCSRAATSSRSFPTGTDGAFVRDCSPSCRCRCTTHPVNRTRERAGRLAVNSLWLWGGGVLDDAASARVRATAGRLPPLRSDDAVLRGLWRLADADARTLPGTIEAIAAGVIATRAFEDAAGVGDATRCAALLRRADAEWFQPALAGLKSNAIERVRLAPGGGIWSLDRRGLKRWWRRAKVLC